MKNRILIMVLSIATLIATSCKKQHPFQSIPKNNWTDENKQNLLKQLKQMANDYPLAQVNRNVEEVAQRALNECIIEYPDVSDYQKHNDFQMGALLPFSKIAAEYTEH